MSQRPRPVQQGLFGPLPEATPAAPATPTAVAPAAFAAELAALASRLPPSLRLGTSSWNFPGWRGIVYAANAPKAQLSRSGLAAYAQHPLLRTVGIDRTYYAPIPAGEFAGYAAQVPPTFRFLVKGFGELLAAQRRDGSPNPRWLDARAFVAECVEPAVAGLGERLGTLLLQFPPQPAELRREPRLFAELLQRFLAALPAGVPYAVELRDEVLLTPYYVDALQATGVRHGFVVHPRMPELARQRDLVPLEGLPAGLPGGLPAGLLDGPSAGPVVVRWMLHPGYGYDEAKERYEPFDRLAEPDPGNRSAIAALVHAAVQRSRAVLVVVNNKAEGSSPLGVQELARAITGLLA